MRGEAAHRAFLDGDQHEVLITIEEGSVGGFASHVLAYLERSGALERGIKVRSLTMPDRFVEQGKPETMYADAGLDAAGIVTAVFAALGRSTPVVARPRLA